MTIIPEKTYTDNPFVDNVIYYAKIMALNSVVKDEEEALANETAESLHAGETLIACVEGRATYGMFTSIPKEILEKYIETTSNLDLFAGDTNSLKNYLNSFTMIERKRLLNNISALARHVYEDHYLIMTDYLYDLKDTWMADHMELYENCMDGTATYEDLFYEIPRVTLYRVIKYYLTNYDNTSLDTLVSSLEAFEEYLANRIDSNVDIEVDNINKALRAIFASHYEMMIERGYVTESSTHWYEYICYIETFNRCNDGTVTWQELFPLFPSEDLYIVLCGIFGKEDVDQYGLMDSADTVQMYLDNYSPDPETQESDLWETMKDIYIMQYNPFLNFDVYNRCVAELYDYYDLVPYMPYETLKMILATYIDEQTNLEVYEMNKNMLDSFLATLPEEERLAIQEGITQDMMVWYPEHYVELNNYYRTYLGLPPIREDGYVYEDTLVHSYNADNDEFYEFGTRFTSMVPSTIYPDSHWRQQLYEFDSYDIGILNQEDILSYWVAACGSDMDSKRYRYLKYLGDDKLDAYTCRKVMNFQLMGVPTLDDTEAQRWYVDTYALNRDYVIRAIYSDAYTFQSDYFNKYMIMYIILNTIMDMLNAIPEMIIHKEVFDSRCIKYLFEANGVPYYSEIPLKYQKAMLKNLNILIKYKSSTKNMVDICNLFGFADVKVFGYYLFKEHNVDSNTGEYIFADYGEGSYELEDYFVMDENGAYENYNGIHFIKMLDYQKYDEDTYTHLVTVQNEDGSTYQKRIINQDADVYIYDEENMDFIPWADVDYFTKIHADTSEFTLKFIKVPIEESVVDYKNDPDYIIDYDEMVADDEGNTWDDGIDHQLLINQITDVEFNADRTKYISVETVTDMTEQAFQVSYFYNMLFDNLYSEDALTVQVPHIQIGHDFRFMDIICYLFALMYLYNDLEDNIMYSPTQILYIKGYNFDETINAVLQDPTCFTQTDSNGNALADYEKENIFDINTRIAEDGYSYQAAFTPYWIRSFNLSADVDAIDAWLYENYQYHLDDFVVDDTLTVFDHVITLRDFYTLNNSYYQKSIFENNVYPLQYNQVIKYAYGYSLYNLISMYDASGYEHWYVVEDGSYMAIIDSTADEIYVMDFGMYINISGTDIKAIFRQYTKNDDGNYEQSDYMFYYYDDDGYHHLFEGAIGIINKEGYYIFAADSYYMKDDDGNYVVIDNEDFFDQDPYYPDKKILNFGQYYIFSDGQYVLDPENTYVVVEKNGQKQYVLATETGDYDNLIVPEDKLYVLHSDGHFVKLTDTDYYINNGDGTYTYNEEECFVITEEETEWYDPTVDPRVYYKKLTDYYSENNWNVYGDEFYVKDENGNYIPINQIMDPNNTYYYNGSGYTLVIGDMGVYYDYLEPIPVSYILVLQDTNDYGRYKLVDTTYVLENSEEFWYVQNSDGDFLLVLHLYDTYEETKLMIVVFNKAISGQSSIYDDDNGRYDPEKTDNVWDENDWYYGPRAEYNKIEDEMAVAPKDQDQPLPTSSEQEEEARTVTELSEDNDIYEPVEMIDDLETFDEPTVEDTGAHEGPLEMNGENMWYYKEPGSGTDTGEETGDSNPVGSGFYMESEAYLGSVTLEKGERYYMAFDIETNFTGEMQIYCTADDSVTSTSDRVYKVVYGEVEHVSQIFTANDDETPEIRFLIYNYETYPIKVGDYVVVSNIRFVKSYNDNFIAQDIPSYDQLQMLYRTNEACYKYLVDLMANCTDYYIYRMLSFLYDSLMISKYNKEAFKIGDNEYAKTYTDFLKSRDSVLYARLVYYKGLDPDTMHKEVADDIIEVTSAIDDCINTYSYGYLYSYFPAVSATYIQEYIIQIINFFKSWKVHMLGINTVYQFNDPNENTVRPLEGQQYRGRHDFIKSNVYIHDTVKINPMDDVNCSGFDYAGLYSDLVQYSNYMDDNCAPKDRVRIISRDENSIRFSDNYGNIHIILASDEPIITPDGGILNITSSESGFYTEDTNEFILSTDQDENADFSSQILNEINLFSGDYIDWED